TRQRDEVFWQRFASASPGILGAILSLVSKALSRKDSLFIEELPRMADFAIIATAALGDEFLKAYWKARDQATEAVIESSPFTSEIIDFMADQYEWIGTATSLLRLLKVDDNTRRSTDWPKDASMVTRRLNRYAPSLRSVGITFEIRKSGGRKIILEKQVPDSPDSSSRRT